MKIFLNQSWVVAAAVWLLLGVGHASAQDKADQLAVIVAKTCPVDDIKTADLQKYFKAEKSKMPDGTKIIIVMEDVGRPERDAALRAIFGMSEAEYSDYFAGQVFTGAVKSAPASYPTPAAVKAFVAANPGAISYVRASDADDSVKVLKVDGKAPGESDYSLKMK